MAANCAPPAKTTSDIANASVGESPFATARAPQSAANGIPATMAGMMSTSAACHSLAGGRAVEVMPAVIAELSPPVLNEIGTRRLTTQRSPLRPGRHADTCFERAREMRLIGESDAVGDLRGCAVRPQQVARASHTHVEQVRMRCETRLGSKRANQMIRGEPCD